MKSILPIIVISCMMCLPPGQVFAQQESDGFWTSMLHSWNEFKTKYEAGLFDYVVDESRITRLRWVDFNQDPGVLDTSPTVDQKAVDSLLLLHRSLLFDGECEAALPVAEQIMEQAKTTVGERSPITALGMVQYAENLYCLNRYQQVEELLLNAVEILKTSVLETPFPYLKALGELADFYWLANSFEKAELQIQEILRIRDDIFGRIHPENAVALNNLAAVYWQMGNYEKTIPICNRISLYAEYTQGNNRDFYANSLINLAMVHARQQEFKSAKRLLRRSKKIKKKTYGKHHPEYAMVLRSLGDLGLIMVKYNFSRKHYEKALKSFEKEYGNDHPHYGPIVGSLAYTNHFRNNLVKAEQLYQQADSLIKKHHGEKSLDYINLLFHRAKLYWARKDYEKAGQLFLQSNKVEKDFIRQRASFLSEKEMSDYVKLFTRNINNQYSFVESAINEQTTMTTLAYDNALFYKGFLLQNASLARKQTLADPVRFNLFHQFQKLNDNLSTAYTQAAPDQAQIGQLQQQLNQIEKEINRTTIGLQNAAKPVSWHILQQGLTNREVAIEFVRYKKQSHVLQPLGDKYRRDYNTGKHFARVLKILIWLFENDDKSKKEKTSTGKTKEEEDVIPDESIAALDTFLYAAVIVKADEDAPIFVPLFTERTLKSAISTPSADLQQGVAADIYSRGLVPGKKGKASKIYELIWAPLVPHLANIDKIYFAPTGLLHRMNNNAIQAKGGALLSDQFQLIQYGSTRTMLNSKSTNSDSLNKRSMLMGGIHYDINAALPWSHETVTREAPSPGPKDSINLETIATWSYLHGTAKEVKTIEEILLKSGFECEVIQEKEASESAFKTMADNGPSPRIIHVATHGFFFPSPEEVVDTLTGGNLVFRLNPNPMMRSGLIMAGANRAWANPGRIGWDGEDGILTAFEISQLDLSGTELVVLSACETGLGDIDGDEGVYGLQRAFKIAGVKNIIMSLWQVPDQQTQELMVKFYDKWIREEMPLRAAFQSAQNEMREIYNNPYLWAGFVLVE